MIRFWLTFLATLPLLAFAAKSDTLIMLNGDRITGEIKKLELGYLTYKTDDVGTLTVKWVRVAHVESNNQFDITMYDGERHYGSIAKSDSAQMMRIVTYTDTIDVPMIEVVEINQIKKTFWNRLNGQVTAGLSYTRANSNLQLNAGGDLSYRAVNSSQSVSYSIIFTSAEGQDDNQRQDANYSFNWFFTDQWYSIAVGGFQQNLQLGLESRTFAALGVGHVIIHDNENLFLGGIGATLNNETSTDGEGQINNEGVVQLSYERFKIIGNSFNLNTGIAYYPSFTVENRDRVDYNLQLLWEIIGDLKWNATFKYSYDSKPISESAIEEDYSIILGLSYSL